MFLLCLCHFFAHNFVVLLIKLYFFYKYIWWVEIFILPLQSLRDYHTLTTSFQEPSRVPSCGGSTILDSN